MRKPTRNDINLGSPEWVTLKTYMMERLRLSRESNDSNDLSPTETAFLRGQIDVLKHLISIEEGVLRPITSDTSKRIP